MSNISHTMFVVYGNIYDWMILKYDPQLFKGKALSQNIARLCIKKNVLKQVAMPVIIDQVKNLDLEIMNTMSTYIQFALPFCENDPLFTQKMTSILSSLKDKMYNKFKFLLIENKDSNLQSSIIEMLNNKDYKLRASVYYSAKYGYAATFDLLHMIDNEWSLRC